MCPPDIDASADGEPTATSPTNLRAFRMTIAYDGTSYFGWQRQPQHVTVQACVEKALAEVTGQDNIKVYSSSRTDTGVHAIGQSAVFKTDRWKAKAESIPFAMNTKLPEDIVIRDTIDVPLTFHPLRHSTGKRYRYLVYSSRKADPINARNHWWVRRRITLDRMREAAGYLVGEHDFYSLQTTGSPRSSTVRNIRSLKITETPHMDGLLYAIDVEANGFLYNMVRNIAGTLVQVGVGRKPPTWINDVLHAKNRSVAGATAPPQGLCLMEVLF